MSILIFMTLPGIKFSGSVTANRELAKSENPGAAFTDIGKVLGAMWNGLSEQEKQTWKDAATGAAAGGETESSEGEDDEEEAEVQEANGAAAETNGAVAAAVVEEVGDAAPADAA